MLQLPLLIGLGHISSSVFRTVSRSDMHRFGAVLIDIQNSPHSAYGGQLAMFRLVTALTDHVF